MMETSLLLRGGGHVIENLFHNIVSVSNLFSAWEEFRRGKRKKKDVSQFELYLEDNIFQLHEDLVSGTYSHDSYQDFYVFDPKRRHIHKASVRDRVLHQAIFRILYPIFDKHFIYDSYSSRKYKGTHYGVKRAYKACQKVSKNWKRKVYVLKCDVRKFFDSIDHTILRELIQRKVIYSDTLRLIELLFESFEKEKGKGLPLGNVTSQLFANVYLNELDQFAKHVLKARYYFRYCDDFIIVHENIDFLLECVTKIKTFLKERLTLDLNPNKVEIRPMNRGIDFLGYVLLPHMVILRTHTKKRVVRKITKNPSENKLTAYLGLLKHCRGRKLEAYIKRWYT